MILGLRLKHVATFCEIAANSVGYLFSLSFVYLQFLFISQFGFKSGIWLLIVAVLSIAFLLLFSNTCMEIKCNLVIMHA